LARNNKSRALTRPATLSHQQTINPPIEGNYKVKKLLMTTVAFTALFGSAAFAGDASYPGNVERGMRGSPRVGTPDYPGRIERGNSSFSIGDDYFSSGRASGHVPAAPDSVTQTQHSDGSVSVSKTYIQK
jgi:hypothetical protein